MDVKNNNLVSNENLDLECSDETFELDIRVSHISSEETFFSITDAQSGPGGCTTIEPTL